MINVVYIYGLGHSGSTLLDLMLAGHQRIIGAGEVFMLTDPGQRPRRIRERDTKLCSCGKTLTHCELWGKVTERLTQDTHLTHADAVALFAARAAEICEGGSWVSDSSKNIAGLKAVRDLAESGKIGSLRVLYLVRDVRSFATSQLHRSGKNGTLHAVRAMRLWKKTNLEYERTLNDLNVRSLAVGYEELCLFPERTLQSICELLEIPFSEGMRKPSGLSGHVATGNPMRIDPERNQSVIYDHRWYFRPDVSRAFSFYPGLSDLNRRLAYPLTGEVSS